MIVSIILDKKITLLTGGITIKLIHIIRPPLREKFIGFVQITA